MPRHTLQIAFAAPVPVGHRVRVSWMAREESGLFSSKRIEHPERPRVEDLDTGIVYEPYWMVDDSGGALRLSEWLPVRVGQALDQDRTVEGIVQGCRVITYNSTEGHVLQTLLVVETP